VLAGPDASGNRSTVRIRYSPQTLLMFCVYILYSVSCNQYYIGHTENIVKRLEQHNAQLSAYTSKADDWEVKYIEEFETRTKAISRELALKK
jgi:putative endonuclease